MIRRRFHVVCEQCGNRYDWEFDSNYETSTDARKQVAEQGWTYVKRRDLCDRCSSPKEVKS